MRRVMLEMMHIKNIFVLLGVLFGVFIPVEELFVIPSIILFILSSVEYYKISQDKKKSIESYFDNKFKKYDEEIKILKEENDKIKLEMVGFKNRESFTRVYGSQVK